PNDNRVVVDAFRFIYTNATGRAHSVDDGKGGFTVAQDADPSGDFTFSLRRMQPSRGGHAVPTLSTGVSGTSVNPAYGFSEQASVPSTRSTMQGVYQDKDSNGTVQSKNTTALVYHSLGASDPNSDGAWDYLPFNDRDFTSVVELAMVPSCPPGL